MEQNTYTLFKKAGFNVDMNVQISGYEIDVYVRYKQLKVIIECKQYENSGLIVRNLIHQWADKNKELNADKVLLIILGVDISRSDFQLAKSRGISIWDQDKFQRFFDRVHEEKEGLRPEILQDLGIAAENFSKKLKIRTKSEALEQYKKNWALDYSTLLSVYEAEEGFLRGHRIRKILTFLNDFINEPVELFPEIIKNKIFTEVGDVPESISYNKKQLPIIEAEIKEMCMSGVRLHKNSENDEGDNEQIGYWPHTLMFIGINIGQDEINLSERNGVRCIVCRELKLDASIDQNKLIVLTESDLLEHRNEVYDKLGIGGDKTIDESAPISGNNSFDLKNIGRLILLTFVVLFLLFAYIIL